MPDAALLRLSLAEAADRIRRRALSPVALIEAVLAQIDALNPALNAFTTLVPREQVLAAARAAEREIAAGAYRGLLHGIPVSVKDLIDTAGLRTTYGSGMFRDHVPEKDGGVPERLRAAGAIITGKTATHELGQGMTTNNYFFGPTRNPWNLEHVPGGSSGGAGAAAAALMGPLHIGTDGGGSIRFPAAFCGVTGLKPTLGLITNRGQFGGAGTSFSVPGPMTRTVRDAALAAQALAGFDPEYLYSRPGPVPDLIGELGGGVRGLRVGTSPDLLEPPPEPEGRGADEATPRRLEKLGARLVSVRMPHHDLVFRTTMGVFAIEGGVGLDALIGDRPRVFGPQVQRIFEITRVPDVATAVHTQQRRQLVARDYQAAFVEVDVLLAPAAPAGAAVAEAARGGARLRLATAAAAAEVDLARYRLRVLGRHGLLCAEHRAGGVVYERAGAPHHLGRVRATAPREDGVVLTVDTDEGAAASVTLVWLTPRTLEVTVEPPEPATLSAVGDRWRSPRSEAIYGLTERLRDSPPIADGVIDIPMEDVKPAPVGSLDRRSETVAMYVRPTFSLYAPFYQSSRGYGLAVAGTAIGLFDVAASDLQTLAFRFEAGPTPESQRLRFHVFVGPEHATILDEYTRLTGRPFVPPAWAFLHWRWRDTLDAGPPALLDGVAMNAEVVDDVTMYEALGIPPGVYHFDRPVLPGEYGFARWAWDETRLPNPDAMLAALRRRGYRIMTFSATWQCGAEPGDNGLEAQMLGFLAPGPVATPHCADVGGTSSILDVTNPAARAWWRDQVAAFVRRNGIDGIKLDRGEEHIPSAATDIWADGRTGREVHNAYPEDRKSVV